MKNNRKKLYLSILAVVILGAFGFLLFAEGDETPEAVTAEQPRMVETISVATYGAGTSGSVVKAAGDAYLVRAESGGRVTKINTTGSVGAGAIIAELENSAQRAAVTQAQGVYEASLAAAGGNTTSQAAAKQDAVRTWNTATVQASSLMYTSIDYYFTESRSNSILGFRNLNAFGNAPELNKRRLAIEEILKRWEIEVSSVTEITILDKIATLDQELAIIGTFIDEIAALVPQQRIDNGYTEAQQQADFARLSGAQTSFTAVRRSVDNARTAIKNASGSGAAASSASVKQALGMLQAAQSAYDKTFIKTPIAGTITSYSVKLGDIINIGADVALITASDTSATIATSFTLPLTAVKYTPAGAYVFTIVDGKVGRIKVETGLVTTANISVTGLNGDEVIMRDVRGLKEGDSVSIQ